MIKSPFLGGGNSNIFGIFTPKKGEDEPNLTCAYFSDGLGLKPPTSRKKSLSSSKKGRLDLELGDSSMDDGFLDQVS